MVTGDRGNPSSGSAPHGANANTGVTNGVRRTDFARNQETRQFKGREFDLRYVSDNRNHVKRDARKFRKRGFHTRVIELRSGVFAVYRCPKRVEY